MIPKTLSASALRTASLCLARYKAENIDYTPRTGDSTPANNGTALHAALENYVREVYIDKTKTPSLDYLVALYEAAYLKVFDVVVVDEIVYADGVEMLEKWYARTDLSAVDILSLETKHRFPLRTSMGEIPFSYIFDRLDLFEEGGRKILRVTDYKSIRANMTPDGLRGNLQARFYDLMIRIQAKKEGIEYDEIHIIFDLLRHDSVGVIFDREDAEDTFKMLQDSAERILAAPDDNPPETLNSECQFCVRKASCATLQRNIAGGGLFTIPDVATAAAMRADVEAQVKGLNALQKELDEFLLAYGENNDVTQFETNSHRVKLFASGRRTITDTRAATKILGPDLMAEISRIGITEIDKLIKDDKLTDEQKTEISKLIHKKFGNLGVKVEKI